MPAREPNERTRVNRRFDRMEQLLADFHQEMITRFDAVYALLDRLEQGRAMITEALGNIEGLLSGESAGREGLRATRRPRSLGD